MFEDYYGMSPEEAGLLQALLSGEQSLPTAQPVVAMPVSNEQSAPTSQPVQAEPYYPPLDLGDWNIGMVNTGPLNLLSDPGPAYDPSMVYRFDTGNKIGVPNEQGGIEYRNAAPVVFEPGQQYVLTDQSGQNVIARANTPEEMQKLVDLSSDKSNWSLYRADSEGNFTPGTQLFSKSDAGSFGSMVVPMLSIAGLAAGLGALTGGIGTAGATAGAATGGATAGTTAATAAGTGAVTGGLGAVAPALGEIVVTAAPTAGISAGTAAALTGATAGGLATSGLLSPPTTPAPAPAPQDIVVTAPTTPTPVIPPVVPPLLPPTPPVAPVAPVEPTPAPAEPAPAPEDIVVTAPTQPAPVIPPVVPPLLPSTPPAAPAEPVPEDIVVEAPKPKTYDEMISSIVGGVAPTLVSPLPAAPSTAPVDTEKSSLLNDIMKYYSLGSGILDALGVGQGGSTAPATPYTSTLGVLPTFGRGQFTPFQGDYETYGQGPEWNFFGGQ